MPTALCACVVPLGALGGARGRRREHVGLRVERPSALQQLPVRGARHLSNEMPEAAAKKRDIFNLKKKR